MTNKTLEEVNSTLAPPTLFSMITSKAGFVGFYFLEISLVQILEYFLPEEILFSNIFLEDNSEIPFNKRKSVRVLRDYFFSRPEILIQDAKLELSNGIQITSHDDGEVCIYFPETFDYRVIITNLLTSFQFSAPKTIDLLESNPNKYLCLNDSGEAVRIFDSFDEYLHS